MGAVFWSGNMLFILSWMFHQVVWHKICYVINSVYYVKSDLPVTLSLTNVWTLSINCVFQYHHILQTQFIFIFRLKRWRKDSIWLAHLKVLFCITGHRTQSKSKVIILQCTGCWCWLGFACRRQKLISAIRFASLFSLTQVPALENLLF